jgi:hypothetical protein
MDGRTFASKFYRRACCCVLFFLAAAASFNGFYDKWHFREPGVSGDTYPANGGMSGYGLAEMLDGTAARPFVYRQLIPALANRLDSSTPKPIQDLLWKNVGRCESASALFVDTTYSFRYTVVYAVTFLFAWLSVVAMYLVCKALGLPPAACVLSPVLMILLIPYLSSVGGYFYDYAELAFMALALWMALKFDWWWMLPLVALAAWNKESFLLVTLTLYPILRRRHSSARALAGTALLAATCAAVYWAVSLRFAHNPGGHLLPQWRFQLDFLLHPQNSLGMEETYGIKMFRSFSPLPLALIAWTAWRGWPRLPLAIRRHGQIAAAINLPLFLLFCAPGETRDFSLLYMVFLLLVAVNFAAEMKDPDASDPTGAPQETQETQECLEVP